MFQKIWGNRKFLCMIGVSQFSAENCSSHSAENFCQGILLFLRKFLVSKSFYGWKVGFASHFFVAKKWSHSAENFREHPCNISKKIVLSVEFMQNRGYHVFLSKNSGMTVPKIRGHPFQLSKNLGLSKSSMQNKGYHVFPSKTLRLTVRNVFVNEFYCFWEKISFRNVLTD